MSEDQFIQIKGARSNNLKGIDITIPKQQFIVVTGLSGSGKSSLVMDTLYAEGQRRYIESLSSYARQFLHRMKKPEVDYINGLCPAIAIEQRTVSGNARSTVGSLTEIYDYLRMLYARVGKMYSPTSGQEVKRHSVTDVVKFLEVQEEHSKWMILMPLYERHSDRPVSEELEFLLQKGFSRIWRKGKLYDIQDLLEKKPKWLPKNIGALRNQKVSILIDRIIVKKEEPSLFKRIADSVQTAFNESGGYCVIRSYEEDKEYTFSNRFELDGISFPELTPQLFNYNNPYGACPHCEGYGRVIGIDPKKVIPNEKLSIFQGAVMCWRGEKSGEWLHRFIRKAHDISFPVHTPYSDLDETQRQMLWEGTEHVPGIYDYFKQLQNEMYKIQNRIILSRFRGKTTCWECSGSRLRIEASYVLVAGKKIGELIQMPIEQLFDFMNTVDWSEQERKIGERLMKEITLRLGILNDVGLGYLHLDRLTNTLSGGETQRIHLTRMLGSNLTDSLYILDEPSIGLHPRDTDNLIQVLQHLRDLGNTVLVVEHEEDIIRKSDYIIDMGPGAGIHGGEIVFEGPFKQLKKGIKESLTAQYIFKTKQIPIPEVRRPIINKITIRQANQNNLKGIDVSFPLNMITVVTGVSGSGKSTLVKDILYPALMQHLDLRTKQSLGAHASLEGDLIQVHHVEFIGQRPLGRSGRSNPVTYTKAYDSIRKLMARQQAAKIRGLGPGHFSFNIDGGRCEECDGEGVIHVDMQFMADVQLICESCKGKRFKKEVLEVEYNGKNINDILEMSIEEALDFFVDHRDIIRRLQPLEEVGLEYIRLGQSTSTLSGGEAQRLKLASYLIQKNRSEKILFLFDEPTTGLHFDNILKLLNALNALVEIGHSVIVIEHNAEIIKASDWVIDLGPEGGDKGGNIVFEGRPEELVKCKISYTGKYLKAKF